MKRENKKTGFTLIELLVVVLIIGVLASIAVPKYFASVERSKAAQLYTTAKTIHDAELRYFQSNNVFTTNMDYLDIKIPYKSIVDSGSGSAAYNCYQLDKLVTCLNTGNNAGISAHKELYVTNYFIFFAMQGNTIYSPNRIHCITNQPKYDAVCKALGGQQYSHPIYSDSRHYFYLH